MFFQRLLQAISIPPIGSERQLIELSKIQPSRFYVENVRAILETNTSKAQRYCDLAVKNGFFKKKIGIECPNDSRIIASFYTEKEIPEKISCDLCQSVGEEKFEFLTINCRRVEFYEFQSE